uniref:Ymf63 n=1 Tax=Tetrahymena rostrata TaxID=5909 RepID=UPI0020795D41|nr:Ymf63 [Tetrahymena rostrata]URP31123.1 Ymf63 [Tetrahymena rostrata]
MKQLKKNYINQISLQKHLRKNLLEINQIKPHKNIKNNITFFENIMLNPQIQKNSVGSEGSMYVSYISHPTSDKFYEGKYYAFESYMSILDYLDCGYINYRFNYKYKYSLITYFIPFLIKNGKKIQTINNIVTAISSILFKLNRYDISYFNNYTFASQFKYYVANTNEIYNLNFVLNWINIIYRPVFDIKCFNVPKIHKKKSNNDLLFKIVYLADKNRLKTANKHIAICIKKEQENKLEKRINNVFLDILLSYKNSYLYTRKMYIYQQAMDL